MKTRMITRTIKQTTTEVMVVDVTTAEVNIISYVIGGAPSDADLLVKLKEIYETDTIKLVHIESRQTEKLVLGMSEDDFVKYAQVIKRIEKEDK